MATYVINLPPVGDVVNAWIRLRTKTLPTAKHVDGVTDLTDVECVEISGYCRHATWSWEGHDIVDILRLYADNPDVQAIVPLWQRWGMHSQKRRTLADQAVFDESLKAGLFPYSAVAATDPDTGKLVIADKNAQLDPKLSFKPVAVATSTDVFVEPLDDGVLDQIKASFGVAVDVSGVSP